MQLVYQTIDWSKQSRALPHFTNGHSSAYFSLPLFLRKINSVHSSTMFVTISATSLEKGDLQVVLGISLCCVNIPVGETQGMANSKQFKWRLKNYLFPRCAIDISLYLKKSSARYPVLAAALLEKEVLM